MRYFFRARSWSSCSTARGFELAAHRRVPEPRGASPTNANVESSALGARMRDSSRRSRSSSSTPGAASASRRAQRELDRCTSGDRAIAARVVDRPGARRGAGLARPVPPPAATSACTRTTTASSRRRWARTCRYLAIGSTRRSPALPQGRPFGFFLPDLLSFVGDKLGGLAAIYVLGFCIVTLNTFLCYRLLRDRVPVAPGRRRRGDVLPVPGRHDQDPAHARLSAAAVADVRAAARPGLRGGPALARLSARPPARCCLTKTAFSRSSRCHCSCRPLGPARCRAR